jgi:hypothetical protein
MVLPLRLEAAVQKHQQIGGGHLQDLVTGFARGVDIAHVFGLLALS